MDKMNDDNADNYIAPYIVDQPEQPAVWNLIGYGLYAFKGMIRVGDIVKQQHDAGNSLDYKCYECNKADCAPESCALGCLVGYDKFNSKLVCPCHAGEFDLEGNVLTGPATKALLRYPLKITSDEITIG